MPSTIKPSQTPKTPRRELKPNPFTTYRDPQTGRWIVVKPSTMMLAWG